MTPPKHEPPDPELWGRVVGMCDLEESVISSPLLGGELWTVAIGIPGLGDTVRGTGPTWNDAARALIAEWEGRKST